MTKILASRELCGTVELTNKDVTIIHELSRDDYFYRFQCPSESCEGIKGINLKQANQVVLDLLPPNVKTVNIDIEQERTKEGMPPYGVLVQSLGSEAITEFVIDLNTLPQEVINGLIGAGQ